MWPVDNLFVCVARVLRAKWRIPDKALKHDRPKRPPIALFTVAPHHEHLGRDIVRCAHRRVCLRSYRVINSTRETGRLTHESPPVFLPCRNCLCPGHRKMYRRHLHTIPRCMPWGELLFDQPSIVRPIRPGVHTSREAKIRKLEVTVLVY